MYIVAVALLFLGISLVPVYAVSVAASSVAVNRAYSTYAQTAAYRSEFITKMNCYGYAIHVYSKTAEIYPQQPGEFTRDNIAYSVHQQELYDIIHNSTSGTQFLDYIENCIFSDFNGLGYYSNSEWTISRATATSSVPTGYRKIALSVGLKQDYHFYLRHSDGTWSHKPGMLSVRNKSFDSNVLITDNNIDTVAREGGYDDGVRYYLIGKSAIIDYPHLGGHASTSVYTRTSFLDCAGDVISKATSIIISADGTFDYSDDVDFFLYTAPATGEYIISNTLSLAAYDVQLVIYDTYGNILDYDFGVGNPSITISFIEGYQYFIKIYDANGNTGNYCLNIDRA